MPKNAMDFKSEELQKKILLLGEPGTGKSYFASTCPTPALVLCFDGNGAEYGGKDFDIEEFKLNETPQGMKEKNYTSWLLFKKVIQELLKGTYNEGKEYKTIIIDSITNMEVAGLNYIAATTPDSKKGASGMNLAMYGDLVVQMGTILRTLYDLDPHVIFSGHIKLDEEVATGRDKARLSVYGKKLPGEIASLFPYVVYADTTQVGPKMLNILRLKPQGALLPRFREAGLDIHALPATCANDWNTLMTTIQGACKK